jgi:hypothetical protein
LTKFHFSIIGHAEAGKEVLLVEWLHDMLYRYNKDSGHPLDSWHVLVREDDAVEVEVQEELKQQE